MNPKEFEMVENAKEALRVLRRNWDVIAEVQRIKARAQRTFYEECLKSGFNPEDSLILTIHHNPFETRSS